MKKRLLILIFLILCVVALPMLAKAEKNGVCGDNLTWTQYDNGLLVISGTGEMYDYSWGGPWDYSINKVIIQQGVTSIGTFAFENCDITSVTLPDSLISIGDFAFSGCFALDNFTFSNGVRTIGEYAFSGCKKLTSIYIPKSVTDIHYCAFDPCVNLTSIVVSQDNNNFCSVDGALLDKAKTTIIKCPVKKKGEYTVPNSVITIEDMAFSQCAELTGITIPNGVTSIGYGAFCACTGLKNIIIPDSVTNIDNNAFASCSSLEKVILSKSISNIGDFVFSGCSSLGNLKMHEGVTSIGECAFKSCSNLTAIVIPDGVSSIGKDAFFECRKLESITLPKSVASIGFRAFYNCNSLKAITVPDGISCIEESVFEGCNSMASITLPDSIVSIGEYAFANCSILTSIRIPNSVINIGHAAFISCVNLSDINIPDSVTNFEGSAFWGCTSLRSIILPKSVISIGSDMFLGCSDDLIIYCYAGSAADEYAVSHNMKVVYLDSAPILKPVITIQPYDIAAKAGEKVTFIIQANNAEKYQWYFRTANGSWTVIDNAGTSASYSMTVQEQYNGYQYRCKVTNSGGSVYSNVAILNVIDGTMEDETNIVDEGECGENLVWTKYDNGLVVISGTGPMWDMWDLNLGRGDSPWGRYITKVIIQNGVGAIGPYAFDGCAWLTDISISGSVSNIGEGAFWGCSSLTDICIPYHTTTIMRYAFAECSNLKNVTFLNKDTYFNEEVFFKHKDALTLCCESGSNVQRYAEENEIKVFLTDVVFNGTNCTNCGSKNINTVKSKEPTCTESGLTEGKYCTNCKTVLISQNVIRATGHSIEHIEEKKPTCTETGTEEYWTCTACSKLFQDEKGEIEILEPITIPATGHDLKKCEKINETETNEGTEEYWKCNECNKMFGDEEGKNEIAAPVIIPMKDKVAQFVNRCYKIILDRIPDEGGMRTWLNELNSGRKAASEIIDRFVNSPEYLSKNYNYGDSVDILYQAMLGRKADAAGKANWVKKLESGQTLAHVINGFCFSREFRDLCDSYGIKAGFVNIPNTDTTAEGKIKAFVQRCYRIILDREADPSGMQTWYEQLSSGKKAAAEIIDRFVNSPEFSGKNYSHSDSVEILYKAMLGRGSDAVGKANWVSKLDAGQPFAVVINGFCVSKEFTGICESYGIKPGSVKVQLSGMADEEELSKLAYNAKAPITRWSETKPNRVEIINPSDTIDMNIGTAVQAVYINEEKAKEFIGCCYQEILGREASEAELENWIGQMVNGTKTPDQIARGFLFSNEFRAKNTGNEDLVKILYRVYMNRDADPEGLKTWTEKLDSGMELKDLLDTFSKTSEFKKVVYEISK